MLQPTGLSCRTFYYRQKVIALANRHAITKVAIKTLYDRHKRRYGYLRITAALHALGKTINHKTVQRLMGQRRLKRLVRPKKYRSQRGETQQAANDI